MHKTGFEWFISILFFAASGCFLATVFTGKTSWLIVASILLLAAVLLQQANRAKK